MKVQYTPPITQHYLALYIKDTSLLCFDEAKNMVSRIDCIDHSFEVQLLYRLSYIFETLNIVFEKNDYNNIYDRPIRATLYQLICKKIKAEGMQERYKVK